MAKIYTVKYRRKREGKTDYRKRLNLLLSKKYRLVVRRSNKHMLAQIVSYDSKGDKVLISINSKELDSYGWKLSKKSISAAYLLGILIAKKAKDKGIGEVVLDIGLYNPHHGSRLFAVAKGAIDNGLTLDIGKEALPSEERIRGEYIKKYYSSSTDNFSKYKSMNINSEDITNMFEEVKKKING